MQENEKEGTNLNRKITRNKNKLEKKNTLNKLKNFICRVK